MLKNEKAEDERVNTKEQKQSNPRRQNARRPRAAGKAPAKEEGAQPEIETLPSTKPAPTGAKRRPPNRTRRTEKGWDKREREPDTNAQEENSEPLLIYGRNAVREAIKSGRSIDKIFVMERSEGGSLREIINMARQKHLVIMQTEKAKMDAMTIPYGYGERAAAHQGIIAQLPEIEYAEIGDIIRSARSKGEKPFILVLDSIQDPHNLGAILRTAECAGVHGVIIPKRRAASVTAAAAKASAGAAMYVKVARVSNLTDAVEKLKSDGIWVIGAEAGEDRMSEARLDGSIALVIGSEGQGISKGLREHCDLLVSIPMFGELNSLNASNAAAILMYEKLRQDRRS